MLAKNMLSKSAALFVAALITLSACKKDKDDPQPTTSVQKTIKELAIEKGFDSLAVALVQTGLIGEFDESTDAKTTVFAPTNAAFASLLGTLGFTKISQVDNVVLTKILLYHVVLGEVKSTDLSEGQLINTLLGFTSRVSLVGGPKLFTTASASTDIVTVDVIGSNGIIHAINEVLVPNAPGIPGNTATIPTRTIATTAIDEGFDSLVVALTRLGLVTTFSNPDAAFTVFAPTNEAFADLCNVLGVNSIAQIPLATLTAAINYHAVVGVISSPQLANGQTITPLATSAANAIDVVIAGSGVQLRDVDNGLSTVIIADVWCTNGIVHVIDRVLLPVDLPNLQ
jgi:transforming growth factor-beta-induced protein